MCTVLEWGLIDTPDPDSFVWMPIANESIIGVSEVCWAVLTPMAKQCMTLQCYTVCWGVNPESGKGRWMGLGWGWVLDDVSQCLGID